MNSSFGDGEMAQSVSALAIHCQAISAVRVVGSNLIGEAFKVDCKSLQHPRVYTPSQYKSYTVGQEGWVPSPVVVCKFLIIKAVLMHSSPI